MSDLGITDEITTQLKCCCVTSWLQTWLPQTTVCIFLEPYQVSNLLVENMWVWVWDAASLITSITSRVTISGWRPPWKCPFKPPDLSMAETLKFATSNGNLHHSRGNVSSTRGVFGAAKTIDYVITSSIWGLHGACCLWHFETLPTCVLWLKFQRSHEALFLKGKHKGVQLATRGGCWPMARKLAVTQGHQEWVRETLLYENREGSLRRKNRDLWWGICILG